MIKTETVRSRIPWELFADASIQEIHRLFYLKATTHNTRGIIKTGTIQTAEDFDTGAILIKSKLEILPKIPYVKAQRRFRRPQFQNNYVGGF